MRLANLDGRLVLAAGDDWVDVEQASEGKFSSSAQEVFDHWDSFMQWAGSVTADGMPSGDRTFGAPVPHPRQIFAVGLNYRAHADESGFDRPQSDPPVFTKFATSITGPETTVVLPDGGHVDWEVELVAVIGRHAKAVTAANAWDHVAGLTVGQDLSERILQMASPAPQFSLGKSLPGFAPIGPHVVTVDEFDDPDDLRLSCSINGEVVQDGRTRDLIFSVPDLIEYLSARVPLLPGDIIFTGTPSGVGMGRVPQRWLKPGDRLVSTIDGIGQLSQTFASERE